MMCLPILSVACGKLSLTPLGYTLKTRFSWKSVQAEIVPLLMGYLSDIQCIH